MGLTHREVKKKRDKETTKTKSNAGIKLTSLLIRFLPFSSLIQLLINYFLLFPSFLPSSTCVNYQVNREFTLRCNRLLSSGNTSPQDYFLIVHESTDFRSFNDAWKEDTFI